jgi:predicted O-linked N-acetylglucosamine transferase (SPINDLY family)
VAKHLARYAHVDIALDTFPYHGTTTTCEALWMGVPVVTLAGQTHVSRVGLSLLANVGLRELVATSREGYVRIAAELAANLPRLRNLRSGLRQRMTTSLLMDARSLAQAMEIAYRSLWRRHCSAVSG